jgi:hypothetical protein
MLKKLIPLALIKLENPIFAEEELSHDDVLIFFDSILADLALEHFQINCEEFKATVSKYDLLHEGELHSLVDQVIQTIVSLSPNIQERSQ